jgi:L-threonylcarbamoyladenylate synthase
MIPAAFPLLSESDMKSTIPRIVEHLRSGRVIAYPTETIYGFGGAMTAGATDAVFRLKDREEHRALLVLIASERMLEAIGAALTGDARRLADRFWPGPLTLVLPANDTVGDPRLRPAGGIAVRLTSDPAALRIVESFGAPVTSTSANRSGLPPARSAAEIVQEWERDIARGELLVIDGGPRPSVMPSTVVDCTTSPPRLVRAGAIGATDVAAVIPSLRGDS